MNTVKIGIIGCGLIGKGRHIPALQSVGELFHCKVVCDTREENARRGAEQLGCDWEKDWRNVVKRDDIEAIILLTPPFVRREIIEAVCEADKSLYCEKPLAVNLEEAKAIYSAVKQSGIVFMTEFVRRFFTTTIKFKELCNSTFAEPQVIIASSFGKPIRGTADEWMQQESRSGGHILDYGIHLVDFCRFVFGVEATSVQGFGGRYVNDTINCNDYESLIIEFGRDRTAHVEVSMAFKDDWQVDRTEGFRPPVRILTEKELIDLHFGSAIVWADSKGRHRFETKQSKPIGTVLYELFYKAICDGAPPVSSNIEDAYKACEIVLQGTHSAKAGKRIALEP